MEVESSCDVIDKVVVTNEVDESLMLSLPSVIAEDVPVGGDGDESNTDLFLFTDDAMSFDARLDTLHVKHGNRIEQTARQDGMGFI